VGYQAPMMKGRESGRVEPVLVFFLGAVGVLTLGFIADAKNTVQQDASLEARIENAIAARADRTKREPTDEDRRALRESLIDTEALVGEAKDLGLDRGDHIVRRRLAQKRRALLRSSGPVEADPRAEAEPAVAIARYSFHHIFLAHTPRAALNAERLKATEDALASGEPWATLGDPFIRGQRFSAIDATDIGRVFGARFMSALPGLNIDTWSPVQSTYGTHLVYLDARTADVPAPTSQRDARAATGEAMRRSERALIEALRGTSPIHREPAPQEQP
jgi:peptidyl-prolyl cis-trans isomerase C